MSRFFIELSYNGTAYNGWQRQPNTPSVQQTLEESLSTILGQKHEIMGAGRTDTGVHAAFAVAHFDSQVDPQKVIDPQTVYHLNCLLPRDIAIKKIYEVDPAKHARFDARRREYKYYITQVKDPFRLNAAWQMTLPLDLDAMQTASVSLMRYEDFTSFSKLHSDNKTNLCVIYSASWEQLGDQLIFTISADRFLRGMVRGIVGTLVDVGRGKMSVAQFCDIIQSRDRALAGAQAPAHGLFLTNILY